MLSNLDLYIASVDLGQSHQNVCRPLTIIDILRKKKTSQMHKHL